MSASNSNTPQGPEEASDLIVKITPIAAAISWSAVNQSVCLSLSFPSSINTFVVGFNLHPTQQATSTVLAC